MVAEGLRHQSRIGECGPRPRSSAAIYVDGVYRKTINTNASKTKHRVVVWQAIYKPGKHTLRVVNKGTPGHPRIDLDAVLLCPGFDVSCD